MSKPPRIIFTHKIPKKGLDLLKTRFELVYLDDEKPIVPQLHKMLPSADYLVPLLSVNVDENLLSKCPKLKGIANYAVGYNNIDVSAAIKYDIQITNTPDVLTNATADLVWALILSVARRIVESDQMCRNSQFKGWLPELMLGTELFGKTLGIIGMGRIGQAVAKRAVGFGMSVQYHGRSEKSLKDLGDPKFIPDLETLLKSSNIISLNVPYSNETHHLIDEREFTLMKKSTILINTARGRVVNEGALIRALKSKEIAGAGLDVFYDEPKIPKELINLNNVVLTPHTGSATVQTREAMAVMVAKNLIAIEDGRVPENIIPEMKSR
ncbi:MAG: 2-hydroxyacid dehydrogenase [Candidatus Hodarchaeales archaeon]|jgi:glyoxylate reductase